MRTAKRILTLFMVMVMAMTAFSVTAGAASIVDTAINMKSGTLYTKNMVTGYSDGHYGTYADYKIVVSSSGILTVDLTSTTKYIEIWLYDSSFSTVEIDTATTSIGDLSAAGAGRTYAQYRWNEAGEQSTSKTTWRVKKGTYYLRMCNDLDPNYSYRASSGKISVKATFPSSSESSSSSSSSTSTGKVSYLTLTMSKGWSLQLGAVVSPTGKKVTWKSSKKSVVSVSSNGLITAKKKGTAIITAKCGSSTKKIKIIVK